MKIRNKILLYFSTTIVLLTGLSFSLIYILFSQFREQQFQQRQHDKIFSTIRFIEKFQDESAKISRILDAQDIHDFYDEKLLIFDNHKDLVFSSLDDLDIGMREKILNEISTSNRWVETQEENYDLIGVYIEDKGKTYYAISKAYDVGGYTKLHFLRNVLIGIFFTIIVIVVFISVYFSNIIAKPINTLAGLLSRYDLSKDDNPPIENKTTSFELRYLTERFNELLLRTQAAFTFQKHTTHHISHQLKTPIAILVSELEKIGKFDDLVLVRAELDNQIVRAKSLGNIINALLEISGIESGREIKKQIFRIDELFFDIMDELKELYPYFYFEMRYVPEEPREEALLFSGNELLIRQAVYNLLSNSIAYSSTDRAEIELDCRDTDGHIRFNISNKGKPITEEEKKLLFHHFFRGQNSHGKSGFGLGLVLAQKIIQLHGGEINYRSSGEDGHIFEVRL